MEDVAESVAQERGSPPGLIESLIIVYVVSECWPLRPLANYVYLYIPCPAPPRPAPHTIRRVASAIYNNYITYSYWLHVVLDFPSRRTSAIGLVWKELRALYMDGFNEYLADLWNILDFISNIFYITWISLRCTAIYVVAVS